VDLVGSQEVLLLISMDHRVSAAGSEFIKDGDRETILLSVDNKPSKNCSNQEDGKEDTKGSFSSLAGLLNGVVGGAGTSIVCKGMTWVASAFAIVTIAIEVVARSRAEVVVGSTGNLGVLLIGDDVDVTLTSMEGRDVSDVPGEGSVSFNLAIVRGVQLDDGGSSVQTDV